MVRVSYSHFLTLEVYYFAQTQNILPMFPGYFPLKNAYSFQISQPPIGDHERHMQFLIRERLRGTPPQGGIKSKGALLLELARELRDLRDELEEKRYGIIYHSYV